jgi:hypothetical protein
LGGIGSTRRKSSAAKINSRERCRLFRFRKNVNQQSEAQVYASVERVWCSMLFLVVSMYIVCWAINSNTAWMIPEAFIWKNGIIQELKAGSWGNVLKLALDAYTFEFVPRTTRPLASLFEIVDTVFRSHLWKYFTPHPSLSLSWFFTLFAGPWLLYRILILRGVSSFAAVALIGVYLAQMGTLSSIVMLFRSGKPVTLFFLIVCWYLCERLAREGFSWRLYNLLLACLFISSLFDEYTLLTYVISALMISGLLRKNPRIIPSFLIPGVLYLLTISYIFPWLAHLFHGQDVALKNYGSTLSLSSFLSLEFFMILLRNVLVLLRESFCIFNPFDIHNILDRLMVLLHLSMTIILLTALFRRCINKISTNGFIKTAVSGSSMAFIMLCGVIAMVFHGFTMFMVPNKVWGPYYYATFIGVLVTLFVSELWKLGGMVRNITYGWMFSLILASMVTFPAINNVYKKLHFYPQSAIDIRLAFTGEFNRFDLSDKQFLPSDDIKRLASIDWQNQEIPIDVPKHLYWVLIECAGIRPPYLDYDSTARVDTYKVTNKSVVPGSNMK